MFFFGLSFFLNVFLLKKTCFFCFASLWGVRSIIISLYHEWPHRQFEPRLLQKVLRIVGRVYTVQHGAQDTANEGGGYDQSI